MRPRRTASCNTEARSLAGGQQRNDMRMLKPRGELDLALEAVTRDAAAEVRRQQLHDDATAQTPVLGEKLARHSSVGREEARASGPEGSPWGRASSSYRGAATAAMMAKPSTATA